MLALLEKRFVDNFEKLFLSGRKVVDQQGFAEAIVYGNYSERTIMKLFPSYILRLCINI